MAMGRASKWLLVVAAAAGSLAGCGEKKGPPDRRREPQMERPPAQAKVEIVPAADSADVAAAVQRELARAKDDGRDLIVYVGAKWCEPCERFHDAALAGKLDEAFPKLRLIEFDADRDGEALARAGYASKMIPLFAVPRADGTASGEQIEGSVKGEGAVRNISPRLASLVLKGRAQSGR